MTVSVRAIVWGILKIETAGEKEGSHPQGISVNSPSPQAAQFHKMELYFFVRIHSKPTIHTPDVSSMFQQELQLKQAIKATAS